MKKSDFSDIAPNQAQLDFIETIGRHYDFVALGDSSHGNLKIRRFALHPAFAEALAKNCKNYFIEQSPVHQTYYDFLRADKKLQSLIEKFCAFDANLHLWGGWGNPVDAIKLMREFRESARTNPEMRFVGADTRMSHGWFSYLWIVSMLPVAVSSSILHLGATTYFRLKGKTDRESLEAAENMFLPGGYLGPFTDDRDTAGYMLAFKEKSAILFGDGHFRESLEAEKTSMASIIQEQGRSLCKVLICNDEQGYQKDMDDPVLKFMNRTLTQVRHDAVLFVKPSRENPSGIKILNPELKQITTIKEKSDYEGPGI